MKTSSEKKNILFLTGNRNIIDLDPAFQRGKVWPEKKKELFIDSLIKGWGVPKLYFAVYKNSKGDPYKYECIDGKQRLSTVFDFYDNKLKVNLDSNYYLYNDLNLKIKEELSKFSFDVEIVEDFKGDELSELFQRLQSGSALNTSEKLKATSGDMSAFIYTLSNDNVFKNKVISKAKRNPHLATMAQVSLLSVKNDIVNLKFNDLLLFLKTYSKFNTNGEEAKKIKNVLAYIDKNFNIDEAGIVFTNRAMFVSCFYLISFLMLRGNIKNLKIKDFFINFSKDLSSNKSDPDLKDFQIAVVQGADSSTSIKSRHKILLKKFIKFDINVSSLLNYETLEEEFNTTYKEKLKLFSGEHKDLNKRLIKIGCRTIKRSDKIEESLPVYIRHQSEHPNKKMLYKYNYEDLSYCISFLKKITQK